MAPFQDIAELFHGYREGTLSDADKVRLYHILSEPGGAAWTQMVEDWYLEGVHPYIAADLAEVEAMIGRILVGSRGRRPVVRFRSWWAAAAILLLAAGTGTWYYWFRPTPVAKSVSAPVALAYDAAPGGNKATLTLSGGQRIILDSAANGVLAVQGGARVSKLAGGRLAVSEGQSVVYNTLATPLGGQYQVTLPDGTRVWLNAASSITYPTAFTGATREVTMAGEAYFEVAHKTGMPFIVHVGSSIVEDIGTQFNINSYSDEPELRTTLVEGAVRVSGTLLKPGEQARVHLDGRVSVAKEVDVEEVVAWKNGAFDFGRSADVQSIMRQLARWYDVVVEYRGAVPVQHFGGEISRASNLSQVLEILKVSGVRFEIEGRKLIVMP